MVHSTKQLLVAALVAVCLKTASSQVCPFGWLERPGSDTCYLLSADSTKYKFPEAVAKCGAYQGQVLIFNSTAEQTWVLKQLQSISSAYSAARAWWLGLQYANNKYQWLDGAQVQNDQIPWVGGKPSHAAGQCYVIQNQKVVSSDCAAWNNVMCTRPKSLPLSCEVDNLWTYINGSCFKTFNDSRSWEDAKSLCELQDAHLATVTTFMEHSYLWDAARNTVPPSKVWTGLTVQLQAGQLALVWVDGTGLDTSPVYWNDSQPGQLG
uniref:C-type lectin n=1 Tax=Littorina littorea TaxID=31216 RepID=A0A0A7RPR3_LITLI|nr:C-type lectin [Littorina littorea]